MVRLREWVRRLLGASPTTTTDRDPAWVDRDVDEGIQALYGGRIFPPPGHSAWRQNLSGLEILDALTIEPIGEVPPATEAAYNDRATWEKVTAQRHRLLGPRVIAYLLEPTWERLAAVREAIQILLEEPTWTPKWHGGTWDGPPILDIHAADVGCAIAMALEAVGVAALGEMGYRARRELRRRVQQPYYDARDQGAPWWDREDNWAAVIHGHAGIVCQLLDVDPKLNNDTAEGITRYLEGGFTADGYCLEGPVYWDYGMQAVMSWHILCCKPSTWPSVGGRFVITEPGLDGLIKARASYGSRMASRTGVGPAFADSKSGAQIPRTTCDVAASYYETRPPHWSDRPRPTSLAQALVWMLRRDEGMKLFAPSEGKPYNHVGKLTTTDHRGRLIELFVQALPNLDRIVHEQHDCGTWQLIRGGEVIAGDPGYPENPHFGKRRFELLQNQASGHPVCVKAGEEDQLQGGFTDLEYLPPGRLRMHAYDVLGVGTKWVRTWRLLEDRLQITDIVTGCEAEAIVCAPEVGGAQLRNVEFSTGRKEHYMLGAYKDGRKWWSGRSVKGHKIVTEVVW